MKVLFYHKNQGATSSHTCKFTAQNISSRDEFISDRLTLSNLLWFDVTCAITCMGSMLCLCCALEE